jgi:hypothetical protein
MIQGVGSVPEGEMVKAGGDRKSAKREGGRPDARSGATGAPGVEDPGGASLHVEDPALALETRVGDDESVRTQVILDQMRRVLDQHSGRGAIRRRGEELHQVAISLPVDLAAYLDDEVRRLNKQEGRSYSAKISRTTLIYRALQVRLPDLALYEEFASLVADRRKIVGKTECGFKIPVAVANAMYEIGVAVPGRRTALAPKAVMEALVYVWATVYNAENLFLLRPLPAPSSRGRRRS